MYRRGGQRDDDGGNSMFMKISCSSVGAVIGRKGSRIREMEQNSGARIKIHDNDSEGSGERRIEIMGSSDNQESARLMIEQVLDGTFQDSYSGGSDSGRYGGGGGGGRYGGGGGGGSNVCFRCGESGHFARDCSSSGGGGGGGMGRGRSFGGGGGGGGGCYKCGESGHFARECNSGGSDSYGGSGRSYDRGSRWGNGY